MVFIFCKEVFQKLLYWILISSGSKFFQFLWEIHENMSNRRTTSLHTNTLSENEHKNNNNHTYNSTESLQGETSVELNTNRTDNTQKNVLQIPESSYSEIFTGEVQNPPLELQQQFSEVFSWEQTQAENWRLRLQRQPRIEAANHLLQK